MKHLFVVRHAKSSWSDPELRDFDRPLNGRGSRDAPRMGQFLRSHDLNPDRLVSSPANRAITTATLIAKELGYPPTDIDAVPTLYGAGVRDTIEIVRSFDPEWVTAMIFGHNPTTTDFVNWLSASKIGNVPTCGVAHIALDVQEWREAGDGEGKLVEYFVPKALPAV